MELSSADMPDLQQLKWHVSKELASGSSPEVQSDDFFCGQKMDFPTNLLHGVRGWSGPVEQMKSGMAPGSAFVVKWCRKKLAMFVVSSVRKSNLFPVSKGDQLIWFFALYLTYFDWTSVTGGALGPKEIHCRITGFWFRKYPKHDALAQLRLSFQWSN